MPNLHDEFDADFKEAAAQGSLHDAFDADFKEAAAAGRQSATAKPSETAPLPVAGSEPPPEPERPKVPAWRAGAIGAGQGLLMGFGDELQGLVGAPVRYFAGDPNVKSLADAYRTVRDEAREEERAAAEDDPGVYGASKAAGTVLGFVAPAGLGAKAAGLGAKGANAAIRVGERVLAKEAAPALARTLTGAGAAGAVGGTMGLGYSEGKTVGEDLKNAAIGGGIGVATGALGANFPQATAAIGATYGLGNAAFNTDLSKGERVSEALLSTLGLAGAGIGKANDYVRGERRSMDQRRGRAVQQTREDVDQAALLGDEAEARAFNADIDKKLKNQSDAQSAAIRSARESEDAQIADLEQRAAVEQLERDRHELRSALWKEHDQNIENLRQEADAIRGKIAKQNYKADKTAHDDLTAEANDSYQAKFKERAAVHKEADKLKAKDQAALDSFDDAIAKANAEAERAPTQAHMAGVKQMRDLHTRLSNLWELSKTLGRPFEYMNELTELTNSLERNTPGEVEGVAPWLANFNEAKAAKLTALENKINASTTKLAAEKAALQKSIEGRDYLAKAAAKLQEKAKLSDALVDEAYQLALDHGLDVPPRESFDPRAKYPLKGLAAPEAPDLGGKPLDTQLAEKLAEIEAARSNFDPVFTDKRLAKLDQRLDKARGTTAATRENIVGRKPEADILREAGLDRTRSPSEIAQDYTSTNERVGGPEARRVLAGSSDPEGLRGALFDGKEPLEPNFRRIADTSERLAGAEKGVGEIMGKHIIARAAWDKLKGLIPNGAKIPTTPTTYDQFVAIDANTGRFSNPPQAAAALGKMYDATAFLEKATNWSPDLARKYAPALKQRVSVAQLLYFVERDPVLEKAVANMPEAPNGAK